MMVMSLVDVVTGVLELVALVLGLIGLFIVMDGLGGLAAGFAACSLACAVASWLLQGAPLRRRR